MDRIVVFTGGFDPVHSGHISAIEASRKIGQVVIGLNSDEWLARKKGKPFMPFAERMAVLKQFKDVLEVIAFDDSNNSASDAIWQAKKKFPDKKIVFANGGDRNSDNIPEMQDFQNDPMVEFAFSVGGNNKQNSSSSILANWTVEKESRVWGEFHTYYQSPGVKVKRLVIEPNKSISMQYHNNRSEFWLVESGEGLLYTIQNEQEVLAKQLKKHDSVYILPNNWHRLENVGAEKLCIVEIQYGTECVENDIVRK